MKNIVFLILCIFSINLAEEINAIPEKLEYDKEKAILGKKLYFDKSLSKDGSVSCNSCHDITKFGVDNTINSLGVGNVLDLPFNTPTSFNSVFNFVQFWNGRAQDLQEQAKGPLLNPKEMANTEENILKIVNNNKEYVKAFDRIYNGKITLNNIVDAIAEFEKTLITPNSPFDKYLKGDVNAISEQAKRGYKAFKSNGCISCHQGVNIGGNMYQKIGIFQEYINQDVKGKYDITNNPEDIMVFKVPSLRNIAKTAPYFHDGSVSTLESCVQFMAYYQLGKFLSDETVSDIVAFLETLTGEYKDEIK